MNEKDFNLAILLKLYEIAEAVWAKMSKFADYGSYSAKDICKELHHHFCFSEEQDKYEQITIKHETFECSFPLEGLFNYITIFERLSGIGRNAKQFVFEEAGDVLGKVTFEINKGMSEVCNFVANDPLRPVMNYIVLDADNNRLVATDGKKVIAYPVSILERSGDLADFYISPKQFALMCKKMKKGVSYKVAATKEKIRSKECTKFEFEGVTSNVEWQGKYVNWKGVFANVSNDLSLQFGESWKDVKKFIKTAKKDGSNVIKFRGVAGNSFVTLEYGDNKRDFALNNTLVYDFYVATMIKTIESLGQIDTMYLGCSINDYITATNRGGVIYMIVPTIVEEDGKTISFVGCKCKEVSLDIDLFATLPSANNRTESVESAKVGDTLGSTDECCKTYYTKEDGRIIIYEVGTYYKNNDSYLVTKTFVYPSESKVLAVSRKELEHTFANYQISEECYNNILMQLSYDSTQKYLKSEPTKEQTKVTKVSAKVERKVTLDADIKKFTFDKVGVNVGDVLTFVDGTEVIAAEGNKVQFCGETFTLSGFCKEFMPSEKRTKSNAYRGCDYFYKDGVKLGKLLKEYQKNAAVTLESKEEVAKVSDGTLDAASEETTDIPRWERKFNELHASESESWKSITKGQINYYLNNSIYVLDDDGAIYHLQVSRYNATSDSFTIKDAEDLNTILWVGADRRKFASWYHLHEITKDRYLAIKNNHPILKEVCKEQYKEPLDGEPSETEQTEETTAKVVIVPIEPLECTEQVIAPSAKDIAAERKELADNANNVVFDVGILAKVVSISLGVPPECMEVASILLPTTEPPNKGVRLVDVGCKLNASDVGDYSLVGGKVVHTLPLPPPQARKTSYHGKLLYHLLIRKQKWKRNLSYYMKVLRRLS